MELDGAKTMFDRVIEETKHFMRGKYRLDKSETARTSRNPRPGKTELTIYKPMTITFSRPSLAKRARKVEAVRDLSSFPKAICDIYDARKTYHDGKWMLIPVRRSRYAGADQAPCHDKEKAEPQPFRRKRPL
jgi:hypothetical protein